jgi:hypothetical protein
VLTNAVGVEPLCVAPPLCSPRWMYRSPSFSGLSFNFAVRSTDFRLGHLLESVLSPLRAEVEPEHWYSLVKLPDGRVDLLRDEWTVARLSDSSCAAAWLLWDLNRAVVESSAEHLLFHAGGVQAGCAGVLLPAPAESGKSTLVAGLVRAGLGYLSDEVVALSMRDAMLLPYPKALVVKEGSFEALAGLEPFVDPRHLEIPRSQWQLLPWQIHGGFAGAPCKPRFVVVPRYESSATTRLRPLPAVEAFLALATNAVNLDVHAGRGLELLGQLAQDCDCFELEMSDLDLACRLVLDLVDKGCS